MRLVHISEKVHEDLASAPSAKRDERLARNYTGCMSSRVDFDDGAPVGRDSSATTPAARRTSNAFGSPGTDSTVKRIDLNDALIKHPDATFVMRAAGDAMRGAGISDGDVLLVDRAITATHGSIVIAAVDGELLCRRLEVASAKAGQSASGRGRQRVRLVAADEVTAPIDLGAAAPLEVWGVVTTIIKSLAT